MSIFPKPPSLKELARQLPKKAKLPFSKVALKLWADIEELIFL